MGDDYSQATTVVAWLGQEDDNSRRGFNFARQMSSISVEKNCYGSTCQNEQHGAWWQALSSLCSRSYWPRLWIIQETLLASDLRIQCRSLSIDWKELANIFQYLRQNLTGFCAPRSKLSVVSSVPLRLEMQRKQHRGESPVHAHVNRLPLLDLVDLFRDALCLDARHKIFGLRSLSPACCQNAVATDYSLECEDVLNNLLVHNNAEYQQHQQH